MDTKRYTTANIEAWNEAAPIHARHNQARFIEQFRDPAFLELSSVERSRLDAIGLDGKDVAQVCCNNGRELISIKRLGAARCVGFDGSEAFVDQARELNEAAGTDCEFVCTDIYDIDPAFNDAFNIVVITIGVLSWMPDLPKFFQVVAEIIRPGGILFIDEQHPFLNMMQVGGDDDPVAFELSYFDKEPYVETEGLDYWQGETYDAKPNMSFSHTLADIIMAGIGQGLVVEHFAEYPEHISNTWYNVEKQIDGFPMSFTLEFRKSI
ncbi:MAG: class I SAM-dependent methyltransferase [Rhodospirillales bacterium]